MTSSFNIPTNLSFKICCKIGGRCFSKPNYSRGSNTFCLAIGRGSELFLPIFLFVNSTTILSFYFLIVFEERTLKDLALLCKPLSHLSETTEGKG